MKLEYQHAGTIVVSNNIQPPPNLKEGENKPCGWGCSSQSSVEEKAFILSEIARKTFDMESEGKQSRSKRNALSNLISKIVREKRKRFYSEKSN